jgi:hydrogenase/urease accessory protein HupE
MKFLVLTLLAITLLFRSPVMAHPTGTSKISIRLIDPDSIVEEVNINNGDLFLATGMVYAESLNANVALYEKRAQNYLVARVMLQVDGENLKGLKVIRWKPGGKGPEDDFVHDNVALWSSPHVITLGAALPKGRRNLSVTVNLWPELGVQAISEVSLFWHDTLLDRHWIPIEQTLHYSLAPDSLAAMLKRAQNPSPLGNLSKVHLFLRFITLGFTHILPQGLDHILFVLGLFFFSTRMRPLFIQITAFTIAHSITLGLAMLGVFSLPPQIVEPLIALSIAIVGIENIFSQKLRPSRWMVVFGFGLIHGMGFAGALKELQLPSGMFWPTLAGFNLGVELGQITVVSSAFLLTYWMWKKPWYRARVVIPASAFISMVALYWFVQRVTGAF